MVAENAKTRTSPYYCIIKFSKKRYLCFVYKNLICSCAEISSETNDRDYSRFLDVLPVVYSGCWAGTWRRQLVLAFEVVTSGLKGVRLFSVKWGEMVVNRGE